MKTLRELRKRHLLLSDALMVTAAVAIAVGLVHGFVRTEQIAQLLAGSRTTLYGTASAGCATLLGFIITTATITDAVMRNPEWERFRKSPAYSEVQSIYFDTMRWLGVGTIVFLGFLIADTDAHPQLACEAAGAWLVAVLSVRMWRSINALEILLRMNSLKLKSQPFSG